MGDDTNGGENPDPNEYLRLLILDENGDTVTGGLFTIAEGEKLDYN